MKKGNYQDKNIFLNYNLSLMNRADFIFFSGGTSGNPKVIPFSKKDWKIRTDYRASCYKFAGLEEKSNIAIMLPFGPWIAGPSAHEAILKLKSGTFPLGMVDSENEMKVLLNLFEKHNIKNLITTPNFLSFFCKIYKKNKFKFKLNLIFTSGEVTTHLHRKIARNILNAEIFSCYASSEAFVGIECKKHDGFHYNTTYIDISLQDIDDNRNTILLTVKGSHLIKINKYKIGDLGEKISKCNCGSNWPKIRLIGRAENAFIINGAVNVFPYQIKTVLDKFGDKIIRCNVVILSKKEIDIVVFYLFTEEKLTSAEIINIDRKLKDLSFDFADVIHRGIVKIDIKNKLYKRKINEQKNKININDKRLYAKEN